MSSINERYTTGHLGDLSGFRTPIPPWALHLNWTGEGFWVIVELTDLLKACSCLKVYSATGDKAFMMIRESPSDEVYLGNHFRTLEDLGVPIVAFSPDLLLECRGGVLTRDLYGNSLLVADMVLSTEENGMKLSIKLPRRLVLTKAPGSATSGGGPELVPAFKVKAKVTGNKNEFDQSGATFGLDENWEEEDHMEATPVLSKARSSRLSFFRKM